MTNRCRSCCAAGFAVLLLLASGCGETGRERAAETTVGTVDGEPVAVSEFEAYLRMTLGDEVSGLDPAARRELLAQLLVYRLVAAEAENAGYSVADAEVEQRMQVLDLGETLEGEDPTPADFRPLLHRSLLVERYLAAEVVGEIDISDEEIDAGLASGVAPAEAGPMVVYRQAMTDSLEDAREIVRRVKKDREPFEEVAGELSLSPDGAQPRFSRVGQLPAQARDSLAAGPKGEVVGPVSVDCDIEEYPDACRYYVFLIEDREDRGQRPARSREEARAAIRKEKEAARLQAYLDGLRSSGRIRIHDEIPAPAADHVGMPEDAP